MSYIANQYNHCTPLSSSLDLTNARVAVSDAKYFTLFDNKLDGSYQVISGEVGLWGTSIADADGILPVPFVVTVTESLTIGALSIIGSSYAYPVDFTVELYDGNMLLGRYAKQNNTHVSIMCVFPRNYTITKYVITITKISSPGVARLYSSYQSWYITSRDSATVSLREVSSGTFTTSSSDTLVVKTSDKAALRNVAHSRDTVSLTGTEEAVITNIIDKKHEVFKPEFNESIAIRNTIDKTFDKLVVNVAEDISAVTNTISADDMLVCDCEGLIAVDSTIQNIHAAMKSPTRQIYGKVYITYTDPLLNDIITNVSASNEAYNSDITQIADGEANADSKFFKLYDNNLSGMYTVSGENSQVGWTSGVVSDYDGYFNEPPYILLEFPARPIVQFVVNFDALHNNYARDFIVELTTADGDIITHHITDNDSAEFSMNFEEGIAEVISIKITVNRVSKPRAPVTIIDVPALSEFLYVGYQQKSDLISINLLEELTYDDNIEALGGMSANEVVVTLDNASRVFNVDNIASPVARQLRRNRKIRPFLGAEVIPGEIEWHSLGTYWSYSWDVPVNSLTASVTGFDTIGLIGTTSYTNHQVIQNKSLGWLIDYVLTDAKIILPFLEWIVDEALYDVTVPYAWFASSSHAAALRKICQSYPMHIYCDREGRIVAAPQKLHLDHYNDIWSDSTNVMDKNYSSLHTVVPNLINVTVISPTVKQQEELVSDTLTFDVSAMPTRMLNFNSPYISDIVVDVDCDATVEYTYDTYSWGIVFNFTGSGAVRSIKCVGNALDKSNTSTITHRDADSIATNGVVTRDISADFIQTSDLALYLIRRLDELAETDKYDVEVTYRGDISLTINDPILLMDGIAPSNKYNIKRHQLTWNGSLTGTANLNT